MGNAAVERHLQRVAPPGGGNGLLHRLGEEQGKLFGCQGFARLHDAVIRG